jgi:glycosyltransferase involved in cell wall biosynthesis
MKQAKVSCLMVTRNRVELARRAVTCFANQTWENCELVIVDDGDEDYTPMLEPFVARGFDINYVRLVADQGNTLGRLRNHSIDLATGDWCVQWDDDEWYHPWRIERQTSVLGRRSIASALRWTLMSVERQAGEPWAFRADAGFATPGTVMHRPDAARYPELRRGEDSVFMSALRSAGHVEVLGRDDAHLFVRCFHGDNTWDERHFLKRLHRRPMDWPAYLWAKHVRHDLRAHRAFRLTAEEFHTLEAMSRWDRLVMSRVA